MRFDSDHTSEEFEKARRMERESEAVEGYERPHPSDLRKASLFAMRQGISFREALAVVRETPRVANVVAVPSNEGDVISVRVDR